MNFDRTPDNASDIYSLRRKKKKKRKFLSRVPSPLPVFCVGLKKLFQATIHLKSFLVSLEKPHVEAIDGAMRSSLQPSF